MKAVTFVKPGHIELIEQPAPQVGPEDILIDMHYVGLCGTDLSSYRGTMPLVSYPRIPGHEDSGIILEKGAQVPDSFAEGDQVMISPCAHCGDCPPCRQGRVNCCVTNRTLGVQRDGAMLDKIAVHYSDVFTSRELSLKELALVEPMGIGYHATRRGQVTGSDQVLVLVQRVEPARRARLRLALLVPDDLNLVARLQRVVAARHRLAIDTHAPRPQSLPQRVAVPAHQA